MGSDPDGQSRKIVVARKRCMDDEATRWIVLALLLMWARAGLTQERSGCESGFLGGGARCISHASELFGCFPAVKRRMQIFTVRACRMMDT